MIIGKKEISIPNFGQATQNIFTAPINQFPDLVKNYLWEGIFNIGGQTLPDLTLRCKAIAHNQGQNEFTLTFDEFQDMYATTTLNSIFSSQLNFDFTIKMFDTALKNVIYSKTYKNCIISRIDEFDLNQESDGKIQIKVHCKY